MGFIDEESFFKEVKRLRRLGAKRISLKTGAYPMRELAMAIRWSCDAGIDLVTIDGASGGTGMSPWRMMAEWGVPSIYLHSMAYELCQRLAQRGERVPDIAFAGGFSAEDHIFKALALGAPFCKAVCMRRAIMIPGMVGKNIGRWLQGKSGGLPSTVYKYGSTKQEIFVCGAPGRLRAMTGIVQRIATGGMATGGRTQHEAPRRAGFTPRYRIMFSASWIISSPVVMIRVPAA